jgi:hypothetical protein
MSIGETPVVPQTDDKALLTQNLHSLLLFARSSGLTSATDVLDSLLHRLGVPPATTGSRR